MAKLISMLTLAPQLYDGKNVGKDERIKATPQIAVILTKLGRARQIPDFEVVASEQPSQPRIEVKTPPLPIKRPRGRPPKAKASK